jgi:hypothetical protein
VQIRPEQVQDFIVLFKRDAPALEFKPTLLSQLALQQCLAFPLQSPQLLKVEVINVEKLVMVFESVQL